MKSCDLNQKLLEYLPEIEGPYNEEVSWQEGNNTGSHIVFEDVLTPYIRKCAEKKDSVVLQKSFSAIEKILSLNDEYAEEVVQLSVLESILFSEKEIMCETEKYMENKTKKKFAELKELYKR